MADLGFMPGAPVRRLDGADNRTLGLLGRSDPASNKWQVTWEDGRETWEDQADLQRIGSAALPEQTLRDSVPPLKPNSFKEPPVEDAIFAAVNAPVPDARTIVVSSRVTCHMNDLRDGYNRAIARRSALNALPFFEPAGPTFFNDGSVIRIQRVEDKYVRCLVASFDKELMTTGWYLLEDLQLHPLPPELRIGEYVRSLTAEKGVGVISSFKKDLVFVTWPAAGTFGGEVRADLVSAIYAADFADEYGRITLDLRKDEVPFISPPSLPAECSPPECCAPAVCQSPQEAELITFVEEALKTIRGNREGTYGTPVTNLGTIATYWSGDLTIRLREVLKPGAKIELDAVDVCRLMVLMKQARLAASPRHRDSHVDTVGYTDCSDILQRAEKAEQAK